MPSHFFTNWGLQIGASLEVAMLSLALADRINVMRANLTGLNTQLSTNVSDLQAALARAEEATRAKSQFLATVSHELRTPLNAIINIPQGLREEFKELRTARCSGCESLFGLEAGEQVGADAPCPECERLGTLGLESEARTVNVDVLSVVLMPLAKLPGIYALRDALSALHDFHMAALDALDDPTRALLHAHEHRH